MNSQKTLPDCGSRPNCVSSTATKPKRREGPWKLAQPAVQAWQSVRAAIAATERTVIVAEEDNYLHAEARSRLLRFVDDLEALVDPDQNTLSLRSASRVGYSDRGVNRRRVRELIKRLQAQGVLAE